MLVTGEPSGPGRSETPFDSGERDGKGKTTEKPTLAHVKIGGG